MTRNKDGTAEKHFSFLSSNRYYPYTKEVTIMSVEFVRLYATVNTFRNPRLFFTGETV